MGTPMVTVQAPTFPQLLQYARNITNGNPINPDEFMCLAYIQSLPAAQRVRMIAFLNREVPGYSERFDGCNIVDIHG